MQIEKGYSLMICFESIVEIFVVLEIAEKTRQMGISQYILQGAVIQH